MTGAEGICGGIATANKNSLRSTVSFCREQSRSLKVMSFLERQEDRPSWLPSDVRFLAFSGDKLKLSNSLVHAAMLRSSFVFDHVTLALPVLPFAAVGYCKTIIIAHGSEADDRMKPSSRWTFQSATQVLTNSHITLRRLRDRLSRVHADVCHLGVSPDFESSPTRIPRSLEPIVLEACDGKIRALGEAVLLLVARIDETEMEKGHQLVVRSLATLRSKFHDVQAVFPGPGKGAASVRRIALDLGVADAVFLPGQVDRAALSKLYQQSFAFVMPSQQEGFGLAYLEAMNYGKPCVGCRNDGAEEIIVHETTGLLIPSPPQADELGAAISRLLTDRCWADRLGRAGQLRVHDCFSAAAHQHRFTSALRRLLL